MKFEDNVNLEDILNTCDDSEIGYRDGINQKTKNFPFCPENRFSLQDKFTYYWRAKNPHLGLFQHFCRKTSTKLKEGTFEVIKLFSKNSHNSEKIGRRTF